MLVNLFGVLSTFFILEFSFAFFFQVSARFWRVLCHALLTYLRNLYVRVFDSCIVDPRILIQVAGARQAIMKDQVFQEYKENCFVKVSPVIFEGNRFFF